MKIDNISIRLQDGVVWFFAAMILISLFAALMGALLQHPARVSPTQRQVQQQQQERERIKEDTQKWVDFDRL